MWCILLSSFSVCKIPVTICMSETYRLIVFCVGGSKEPTVLYVYYYILTIERYII